MYFTSQEKAAIVKMIGFVEWADGQAHPRETDFGAEVCGALGYDYADAELCRTMSKNTCLQILSNMSFAKKELMSALMIVMANMDGDVVDAESLYILGIQTVCNLPILDGNKSFRLTQDFLQGRI